MLDSEKGIEFYMRGVPGGADCHGCGFFRDDKCRVFKLDSNGTKIGLCEYMVKRGAEIKLDMRIVIL